MTHSPLGARALLTGFRWLPHPRQANRRGTSSFPVSNLGCCSGSVCVAKTMVLLLGAVTASGNTAWSGETRRGSGLGEETDVWERLPHRATFQHRYRLTKLRTEPFVRRELGELAENWIPVRPVLDTSACSASDAGAMPRDVDLKKYRCWLGLGSLDRRRGMRGFRQNPIRCRRSAAGPKTPKPGNDRVVVCSAT